MNENILRKIVWWAWEKGSTIEGFLKCAGVNLELEMEDRRGGDISDSLSLPSFLAQFPPPSRRLTYSNTLVLQLLSASFSFSPHFQPILVFFLQKRTSWSVEHGTFNKGNCELFFCGSSVEWGCNVSLTWEKYFLGEAKFWRYFLFELFWFEEDPLTRGDAAR